MTLSGSEEKPVRVYFKSYLKMIENSVGSSMFRNFYVKTASRAEFDAFADGDDSCAFFVSAILVLFKKLDDFHGTVQGTLKDLKKSGWQVVDKPAPGDVLVWEPQDFEGVSKEHIGFYIGSDKAVSTSWKTKTVVEHTVDIGGAARRVTHIFRMPVWAEAPEDDA
jgi:hypothetical protein